MHVESADVPGHGYTPLARCAEVASTQHGVVGASQAIAAGLSRDSIRRLVAAGTWRRVRPSVFALWIPESGRALWLHRLSAAALWLGDAAAVSHRAAAVIRGLEGVEGAPLEFSTSGRQRAFEMGLVLHRVKLEQGDIEVHGGFRVTSVARTLVDLCAVAAPKVVELALESALRGRSVTIDQIRAALERSAPRQKGRRILRFLLDRYPGRPTESSLEVLTWGVLRESELPPPVRQYEVKHRGRRIARVDFAYPHAKLAVEADGYGSHSSRADWQRDRARQNAIIGLGWTVYRATWDDVVRHPQRVIRDIAALLERLPMRET
jgi:very-short-patch-repair endonuclease